MEEMKRSLVASLRGSEREREREISRTQRSFFRAEKIYDIVMIV